MDDLKNELTRSWDERSEKSRHREKESGNGDIAREWMILSQVFAGPAEKGPDAGTFK